MRRGQNPSLVLDGIHAKVKELNDTILPKGMKIETYLRPQRPGRPDAHHGAREPAERLSAGGRRGLAVPAQHGGLGGRRRGDTAVAAGGLPRPATRSGLPANLISMGAIDFGILVDGAVVLVENVIHALRHEHPEDRRGVLRLVVRSAVDVGRPTLYAMLIIIAALVPVFTLRIGRGPHFPAAGADLFLRADRRAGICAHAGAGAVRGAVPAAPRQAAGAGVDRAHARAYRRSLAWCSAAGRGSSRRRSSCSRWAALTHHAAGHRVPARTG